MTDKGPKIAERFIETIRNLLKEPMILAGNADSIYELLIVIRKYNDTIHCSTKMTPIQASKKSNKKVVYNNLKDNRKLQKPNSKLGDLRFSSNS